MIKNNKKQHLRVIFVLCVAIGLLAGCGVKPHQVDPPADVTVDTFPQTYPPADSSTRTPGRYLPPNYTPQAAAPIDDKGHTTP